MNPALNWSAAWQHSLALPQGTPEWVIASLVIALVYVAVILPSGAVFTFVARKMTADFQARVGPNRAGPGGFFQPFADVLKLLQKERGGARDWRETLWFTVHTMALYSTIAVLPLGSLTLLVNTDMSAFLPFWAALVLSLGTMLLGLNQGSVPGLFGGIRVAAQAIAGAFPALIALLCAALGAGGFSWTALAAAQSASPLHWTAFSNPFQFIAFLVFVCSGLLLLGYPPLDGGLSLPDIHGGVASHLQGRRLSLFLLGRFYGFILWCLIASVLFLGGWSLPDFIMEPLREAESWRAIQLLEMATVLLKTMILMLAIVWVAGVNPRVRSDQITDFSWKILSPLSLLALAGSTFFAAWVAFS